MQTFKRFHEDDETEAKSIIAWIERRLEFATRRSMIRYYLKMFKEMWIGSFGNLDNVPQDFKDKWKTIHDSMPEDE